jgi:hypothetical protein
MTSSDVCQKAETSVVLVVCFSQPPELRWLPNIDTGEPQFQEPYGSIQKYMEGYSMHVCDIIIGMTHLLCKHAAMQHYYEGM